MTDSDTDTMHVSHQEMKAEFNRVLLNVGFTRDKANTLARIFMENSLDGVYTHGVYRFPRFIQYVRQGLININAEPSLKHQSEAIEQWDGNGGPGPLNADACSKRAMELASNSGIGCVALANTNHWMRGGTYGWEAAKSGFALIAWTNTIANMPPWGGTEPKLGNNPIVFAVPFDNEAIVLDMAMSQYSFGALELQELKKQKLPVPGGFGPGGDLTDDPTAILSSRRVLPIGYWKGAGMSLLLDILATILSGGLSVKQISEQDGETNLSQVFIAIDISKLHNFKTVSSVIHSIVDDYRASAEGSKQIVFPGERVLKTRDENTRNGIPVFIKIWDEIRSLA